VLVDLTLCVGCLLCETACARAHGLPDPSPPSAPDAFRRPGPDAFTVVNRFPGEGGGPVWTKYQCMHCLDPACASACLVGALHRDPATGAVVYDASRCMGCRYCMVACPFQVPSYEYAVAGAPRVRKCDLCFERLREGRPPACVEVCPGGALSFGRRADLLASAKDILAHPVRGHRVRGPYLPRIYGEHEAGGGAWLYLSGQPFDRVGLPPLPDEAPTLRPRRLQHALFHRLQAPLLLLGLLGLAHRAARETGTSNGPPQEPSSP
jgi:Fe-S-cluster-containing dehydrogenase component